MSSAAKKYQDLLRQSPVGCLVVEKGVVKAMNPEAVDTLGVPSSRVLNVELAELLLPEFEEQLAAFLAVADDKSRSIQVRLARAASPIELTFRKIASNTVSIGVRSLLQESFYSAAAKGDLTHDQITSLPNRYYVLSELERQLGAASGRPMSIVAMWVDDLGTFAEDSGGAVRDKILTEVAGRLEAKLRGPDLLGRFDATGFLALLRADIDIDQLTEIGDRLRDEIAFPVEFEDSLVSFTTSLAIGNVDRGRASMSRVLGLLEAAAQRAGSSGGDRTEVVQL